MSQKIIPYFQHDHGMRNDVRIKALRAKYGATGYAIYCWTLEVLLEKECEYIEMTELNLMLLSGDFMVDSELLKEIFLFMGRLELFTIQDNKLSSIKLKKRLENVFKQREAWREAKKKQFSDEKTDENWKNQFSNGKSEISDEKTQNSCGNAPQSIEENSILENILDNESISNLNSTRDPKEKAEKFPTQNTKNNSSSIIENEINENYSDEEYNKIRNVWFRTFGRSPTLPEMEITSNLMKQYTHEDVYSLFKEASLSGFKKIKSLINAIVEDENGKPRIRPKEQESGNTAYKQQPKTNYESRAGFKFDPDEFNRRGKEYEQMFGNNTGECP